MLAFIITTALLHLALSRSCLASSVKEVRSALSQKVNSLITFDKETASPLGMDAGIVDLYYFPGWSISKKEGTLGLNPETPPNNIVAGARSMLSNNPYPLMDVRYTGSPFANYSLHSFWWGCVINTQKEIFNIPTTCVLTVTGYDSNGPKASESFSFTVPLLTVTAQMVKAEIKNKAAFSEVLYVSFTTTGTLGSGLVDAAIEATLVDSINATSNCFTNGCLNAVR